MSYRAARSTSCSTTGCDVESLRERARFADHSRETFDVGARHLRAHRAREVRAVQPPRRHRGAVVRRREGAPAAGQPRRGARLRRVRHARRGAGLRDRRHAAALRRRDGGQQLLLEGRHRHRRRRHADQRQRQPADGARHADAAGGVRAERVRRPLRRHDVPERAAGRLEPVATSRRAPTPDGADFESDPLGPRYRLRGNKMWISQRRARADREHRPPRAREDPRRRTAS